MARISSYGNDQDLEFTDRVIGTDGSGNNDTVNFTLQQLNTFWQQNLGNGLIVAADNAAAITAGVGVNQLYRTADGDLRVRF